MHERDSKVREGVSGQTYTHAKLSIHHFAPSFPLAACMDGIMVEGREYFFSMFQARESLLVAERAAFPVKMLQEGVSEHSSHFACTRRSSN